MKMWLWYFAESVCIIVTAKTRRQAIDIIIGKRIEMACWMAEAAGLPPCEVTREEAEEDFDGNDQLIEMNEGWMSPTQMTKDWYVNWLKTEAAKRAMKNKD